MAAEATESELQIEDCEFSPVKPELQLQEERSQDSYHVDREARIVVTGTANSER